MQVHIDGTVTLQEQLNLHVVAKTGDIGWPTVRLGCPRIVLPVCWKQIVQLGDTTTNYQIAPGDRIYVPGRGFMASLPGFSKHEKSPCACSSNTPQQ